MGRTKGSKTGDSLPGCRSCWFYLGLQADPTGTVLAVYLWLVPEVFLWLAFLNITLAVRVWGAPGPTPISPSWSLGGAGGAHPGKG